MKRRKNIKEKDVNLSIPSDMEYTNEEEKIISTFRMPYSTLDCCGMTDATDAYNTGINMAGCGFSEKEANTQRMMYHNTLASGTGIAPLYDAMEIPSRIKNDMCLSFVSTHIHNIHELLQNEYSRAILDVDMAIVQSIPNLVREALGALYDRNIISERECFHIIDIVEKDISDMANQMVARFSDRYIDDLAYSKPPYRLDYFFPNYWNPIVSDEVMESKKLHATLINILPKPVSKVSSIYNLVYSVLSHAITSMDAAFDETECQNILPMVLGYIDGKGTFINYANTIIELNKVFVIKIYDIQNSSQYKKMNNTARRLFTDVHDDDDF